MPEAETPGDDGRVASYVFRNGLTKHCFGDTDADTMNVMDWKVFRILFLLWLGWYLSGPLFEMVDSWDTPQEEMSDVVWSASGALSLVAVGVCIGMFVFRKFRELCRYLATSPTSEKLVRSVSFEFPTVFDNIMPGRSPGMSSALRI